MIAAHLDAPRLDLKPSPLVEDSELAMLKTHYYGGVKKYQWLNIPLAFVGTVVKSNGESVDVSIGMSSDDPVFMISDLLPHLDNREGDFRKVFQGKDLNAMSGSIPITA
jgi:aspartyl aminopeptidase